MKILVTETGNLFWVVGVLMNHPCIHCKSNKALYWTHILLVCCENIEVCEISDILREPMVIHNSKRL